MVHPWSNSPRVGSQQTDQRSGSHVTLQHYAGSLPQQATHGHLVRCREPAPNRPIFAFAWSAEFLLSCITSAATRALHALLAHSRRAHACQALLRRVTPPRDQFGTGKGKGASEDGNDQRGGCVNSDELTSGAGPCPSQGRTESGGALSRASPWPAPLRRRTCRYPPAPDRAAQRRRASSPTWQRSAISG